MKIAINAWTLPANLTIHQGFRVAKGAGFDGVELNLDVEGYLALDLSDAEVEKLRSAAENMSLELRSVCSGLYWKYSLTAADKSTAETAKEVVRKGLHVTKLLGGDTLLVVPGQVTPDVPYDVAYQRSQAALRELAKEAEKHQVIIGIENVWNKFLLSPLEMARFIDEIGSPYVQAYFDVGNVLAYSYPQHWISVLGSRIKKVHVKDFRAHVGNWDGFVNIAEGDVDWTAVKAALAIVGYDDVVTAEIGGYKTLPELGIRHAGETLKRLFKGA